MRIVKRAIGFLYHYNEAGIINKTTLGFSDGETLTVNGHIILQLGKVYEILYEGTVVSKISIGLNGA